MARDAAGPGLPRPGATGKGAGPGMGVAPSPATARSSTIGALHPRRGPSRLRGRELLLDVDETETPV
ncbi:MAG TPA: hypothetical protein VK356_06890, partial [Thermomicrobiales bacterium]|nr:hypothetical protein [Thermomicrobiales bacterium]